MFSLAALFALAGSAHAGLRPITNLTIVNPIVSPDGFSRPAVLPCGPQKNGSIDRTIINGTKVSAGPNLAYWTDIWAVGG